MDIIMTYITQSNQIFLGVFATIFMLMFMMKLQHFSRIISIEYGTTPTTTCAFEFIPL